LYNKKHGKKILILYLLVIAIIIVMIVMFSIYCPRITANADEIIMNKGAIYNNEAAIGQLQQVTGVA
jgi:CHASE3 domain sensor protein